MKLISTAGECSITKFIACMYDENLRVLVIEGEPEEWELNDAWENIHTEYMDLSGAAQTEELNILRAIGILDTRVRRVNTFLMLQRKFIKEFDMPLLPALEDLKRYGHNIFWDKSRPDREGFLKRLVAIESKEMRYQVDLEGKIKELVTLNMKKEQGEYTAPKRSRKDFIGMLINLQRAGYVIVRDTTTVEDLAVMIKIHTEACQAELINKNRK